MANKRILQELLRTSYSKDELYTLATDLAGNAELIFSDFDTVELWARELVEWCGRRKKIEILIDQIKKERPEVYRANEKKLEQKTASPLAEVQSVSEEIEEVFGALKSVNIKKDTVDRKLRVFLCHTSQDKPIVRELYRRLLAESWIDPWLDRII